MGGVTAPDVVCDFLEAAIHTVLALRGIYPPHVFECVQKYRVPVRMCVDTDVNAYIVDVLSATYTWLKADAVDQVHVTADME